MDEEREATASTQVKEFAYRTVPRKQFGVAACLMSVLLVAMIIHNASLHFTIRNLTRRIDELETGDLDLFIEGLDSKDVRVVRSYLPKGRVRTNEIQCLWLSSLDSLPKCSFELRHNNSSTRSLRGDCTVEELKLELQRLPGIGRDNVDVIQCASGKESRMWKITFVNDLAGIDMSQVSIDASDAGSVSTSSSQCTVVDGGQILDVNSTK